VNSSETSLKALLAGINTVPANTGVIVAKVNILLLFFAFRRKYLNSYQLSLLKRSSQMNKMEQYMNLK